MTPNELREEIRKRVDTRWKSRAAFAREVGINYPNFNEYLNAAPRAGAKGKGRTISADMLLKIAPVIGLTISASDQSEPEQKQAEKRAEPPMHAAQIGGVHGDPIPELFREALLKGFVQELREVQGQLKYVMARLARLEQGPKGSAGGGSARGASRR